MKVIIEKLKKEETGASQIIEMTLIFPFVLMIIGFLLYLASYVMQSVMIYNDAQRIAVAATRESAMPGYDKFYEGAGVTTVADFNWPVGKAPDITTINKAMSERKPYRYWGNGFLDTSDKNTLEANMKKLVTDSSFLASSNVDCTITTKNNILNQQIQVRVVKYINTPNFVKNIGLPSAITIDVTATAVVSDTAEFIRNTDMTLDLAEYMFNELKIGKSGQTMSQKMSIYKQKFQDTARKIGISF